MSQTQADAAAPAGSSGLACVLTTIQEPTACVRRLSAALNRANAAFIVIGDRKGPGSFDLAGNSGGLQFFPLTAQQSLPFQLAPLLPTGHYARKNLGYLLAIQQQARCIYETDDDNMPDDRWIVRKLAVMAERVEGRPWCNVFRLFSPDELIWPRGFPLRLISDASTYAQGAGSSRPALETADAPIQQGLADAAPDVDAVWRLIYGTRDVRFKMRPSVRLPAGTWCPFNSQSTWWWPRAYPLLYLPSHCSFRMTDIWRSFIAQRCLWEMGGEMVFHGAEVVQERNLHNLMRDFGDEVSGYLGNDELVVQLQNLRLDSGPEVVLENMVRCYQRLVEVKIFPPDELQLVDAWAADVRRFSFP